MRAFPYDVIVVGGGHAGCEAAITAARLGCSTALFSLNLDRIAWQPCNPAVGGPANSQLVHEVDALGGEPGIYSARFVRPDATYPERFAEIYRRLAGIPRPWTARVEQRARGARREATALDPPPLAPASAHSRPHGTDRSYWPCG